MSNINLSKVILGTGNYNNVKSGNTVSITGDGGTAWGYYGPSYKKLAPKLVTYIPYAEKYKELSKMRKELLEYKKMRKAIEDEYIKSFYDIRLRNLNVMELLSILREKFGDNIILLCHEQPEEFCHRRLIADYIELKTGIYIPEISVSETGIVKKLQPIRYKNRLKQVMNERNDNNEL